MNTDLRNRASKNFDKHLTDFLTTGKTSGFPESRLSKEEWDLLNQSLIESGVQLVPHSQNGHVYYWFTNASRPVNKTNVFARGRKELKNRLIEIIQQKYPNLSKITILNILRSDNPTDVDTIFKMLRYKQDGEYTDVSQQEFEDAFYYAITSCSNDTELINKGGLHNWNGIEYALTHNMGKKKTQSKHISMSGLQNWTWFRFYDNGTQGFDTAARFHISLNVRVTKDLLKVLDTFLVQDGGKYINLYKFPKTDYYDEILYRHDTVTIYTKARNPELEKQIARAIQPFVRSKDGLIGEILGKGISICPETTAKNKTSVGRTAAKDIANIIKKYSCKVF